MPTASQPRRVDGPRQPLTTDFEIGGKPSASKPKCVDGPRQQLTETRKLRECLLSANESALTASLTTHNDKKVEGMPIASTPKLVDGPRQQLTTGRLWEW